MLDTITRFLAPVQDSATRNALMQILFPIGDRMSSKPLNSAGLVIKAAASPVVKTGAAAFVAIAKGITVTKPAATDMPALVGTVANAQFNVFCFFIDSAGNLTTAIGTPGATLAAMKYPAIPQGVCVLGLVLINPTGTGAFVGGTTALDDATVVPNAVYVSTTSAFDPSILLF